MKKIFLLTVLVITQSLQKSAAQSWSLTGNAGTTSSHFVGTTDAVDLKFRTSGSTRMTINSAGYASIGTTTTESNSRLYTYFAVPTTITQDVVRAAMRSRIYGSSATRANGYLGAHYSSSGSSLVNLPVGLTYMGVLGIKEDADDNGAGVVGWNKSNATTGNNYGVFGLANGIAGIGSIDDRNVGVYGSASGNLGNIGVYGDASGTVSWAGYFTGRGYFSDKVGIGVESPSSMLTVDAPTSTAIMSLRSNGSTKMYLNSSGYLGIGTTAQTSALEVNSPASVSPFKLAINGSTKLIVNSSGRLGMGTTSPTARLHIKTTTDANCGYFSNYQSTASSILGIDVLSQNLNGASFGVNANANGTGQNYAVVGKAILSGTLNYGVWGEASIGNTGSAYGVYGKADGGSTNTPVYAVYGTSSGASNHWAGYFNGTTYSSSLRVGTTDAASGYIVSVGGKLICEEVKVALENDWPDYVFSENHSLMPLEDLKNHIKENKHLPGIPSASEVKENGGYHLGEMQQKLLEKVEELTLYVIKLNDENKELRTQVESLKK